MAVIGFGVKAVPVVDSCTPFYMGNLSERAVQGYEVKMDYLPAGKNISGGYRYVPDEIIVKFSEQAALQLESELDKGKRAAEIKLTDSLDELKDRYHIKKFRSIFRNFRKHRRNLEAFLNKDLGVLSKREKRLVGRLKRVGRERKVPALERIYRVKIELNDGQSLMDALQAYQDDSDVEYAELNYKVRVCLEPNDPNYPLQWALANRGQMYPASGTYNPPPGTYDCDIDANEAWEISTGSGDITVAVVDTGVDYSHRDIADNIWFNESELNGAAGVDDDENGYIDDIYGYDFVNDDGDPIDDHGHGTHCAGIIAADGNNGLDITGLCWDSKIMSLKFLSSEGSGDTADAIEAFYYAVAAGADVVSNSWGGGGYTQYMQEAIDYAHSQGVIMVAAAGNDYSNTAFYPANYEHMISVAATNSNDEKPAFSNYGDWVDIAAPGVDILSLRAAGTSLGTTYGNYKTIASGTSMACPHVAGACALLLSVNPNLTSDDAANILKDTVDPIAPGVCDANGRINVYNAILSATEPNGHISVERDYYRCSDTIKVWVADSDLIGNGTAEASIETTGGDFETITLSETSLGVGVFAGTISAIAGELNIEDGLLQISHGEIITATYEDANDSNDNPATVTDTAIVDCCGLVIFNVFVDSAGPKPKITFDTNEPGSTKLFCGTSCPEPNDFVIISLIPATSHAVTVSGVSPYTTYYFIIKAYDLAGNETTDSNSSNCYRFITDGPNDIYVPSDYNTIQSAIDHCWDSGAVWVADGNYTGEGNRDIDFLGRSITVSSVNGPANCIIDCNGSESSPHRGFFFHRGEGPGSVLSGFTIINGYGPTESLFGLPVSIGGGICCFFSSPTIKDCLLEGNAAGYAGGGISCHNFFDVPAISNCIVRGNSSGLLGAGIYCSWGFLTIENCTITGNKSAGHGGGVRLWNNIYLRIKNCTIADNRAAEYGGGGAAAAGNSIFYNCILWNNTAPNGAQLSLIDNDPECHVELAYSNLQEDSEQSVYVESGCILNRIIGNINIDPCFVGAGYWDNNSTPGDVNDDFWVAGDEHLQSQAGRWDPNSQSWVNDAVTSRCVDAGNPGCDLGDEISEPNNIRINIGAFGGTAEASKTPANWSLLGDLTNDGTVDEVDFAYTARDWQMAATEQPGDLDRNGVVDFRDIKLLVKDWLEQTSWHKK